MSASGLARRSILVWCIAAVAWFAAGCSHLRQEPTPADWPATWQGRSLMGADHAWVYASSASAAEEAAKLAADAAGTFRRATGVAPPRVLLIVTDVPDPPLRFTRSVFDALELHLDQAIAESPPEERPTDKQRTLMKQVLANITRCAPVALAADQRPLLADLPPAVAAAPQPIVLVSTRRVIAKAADDVVRGAADASEMNLAARILAAPMLGFARSLLTDKLVEAGSTAALQAQETAATAENRLSAEQLKQLRAAVERRIKDLGHSPEPPAPLPQADQPNPKP